MSSFTNSTTNFDNLLLQTLMGRLQIRPPQPSSAAAASHHPLISQSLEDLLFDAVNNLSDLDDDDDEDDDYGTDSKTQLAREESKLEKEIIKVILAGNTDSLKPNSGQAVTIGEHHICVGFHEETGSEYRVWEWHGHIMLFDEEEGYMPEYIYGNYFERLKGKPRRGVEAVKDKEEEEVEKKEEEQVGNLGLRELIDGGESAGAARILHRNANAGSPRCI
ncbi:hypothetical protein CDL15_Pgr020572 [Punica granatum]|uniref:Uncharacterized protein n=1 Tax=Punica granatum TaxID=22663 RepID=A0A218VVU7_PUNGR|nr:hypothetical protein CDL15_Pgr020572 [Punica granatum]PKI61002.1 hypothetical protein CRG98_018632 [Punica granatum]